MKMKYTSNSEVTACQEPRLLRWNVDGTVDWEFRFEPVPAGDGDTRTQVIHQYRWTLKMPGLLRLLLSPLLSFRNRQNVRGMVGSVRNLARLAGTPEPTDIQVSQEPPALTAAV